jgi:hypothetical protein
MRVPVPTLLSTPTSPSIRLASWRTMERPRPVPLADGDLIALGQVLARYHDGAERPSET